LLRERPEIQKAKANIKASKQSVDERKKYYAEKVI
jgi:outer membrane protein TolC